MNLRIVWLVLATWLVKSVVVSHWRAKAIYIRFMPRILMAGFQLYFLSIVVSKYPTISLMPWRYQRLLCTDSPDLIEDEQETHKATDNKRRSILDYFVSKPMGLLQLNEIVDTVASLAQVLGGNDGVAEVEKVCRGGEQHISKECIVRLSKDLHEDDVNESLSWKREFVDFFFETSSHVYRSKQRKLKDNGEIKEKSSKKLLMNDGASLLLEEVKAQQSSHSSGKITHEMLRKWMWSCRKWADCIFSGLSSTSFELGFPSATTSLAVPWDRI